MIVCLGVGIKQINLSILMLENQFSRRFVDEHSENGIIRLMFHYNVFVLQMIKFELGCVIECN